MSIPLIETFGKQVKKYRERLNLTQKELAQRANLSERTIQDIENSRIRSPHKDTVRLLAKALELSPSECADFEATARKGRNHDVAPQLPQPALVAHPGTEGHEISATHPTPVSVNKHNPGIVRIGVFFVLGLLVLVTITFLTVQQDDVEVHIV